MKKITVYALFALILISSCAALREKRAANRQPYKPHKSEKMKKGKNNK